MKKIQKKLIQPLKQFIHHEATSGLILMGVAVFALLWANLNATSYQTLIHLHVFGLPLHLIVNDGLMTLFFLVMGHEIKRELLIGELSSLKRALLPAVAAFGGMVVPALIYVFLNSHSPESQSGWGIPMATDIAFAMGVLTLLGKRIPTGLKVFLLALAIVDDLGAVLVIALFYTPHLQIVPLALAFTAYAVLGLLLWKRKVNRFVFFALGSAAWFAVLKSGVHATIGGVVLGLLAPIEKERDVLPEMDVMHQLISFVIMPVFALMNAGVGMSSLSGVGPVLWGVLLGLFVGKPLGILLSSWIAVRAGWASLPHHVNWRHLTGAGFLGGIGFTMALFVAGLSLGEGELNSLAKLGILTASLLSAIVGAFVLSLGNKSESLVED